MASGGVECKRCGKCCETEGFGECPHLVRLGDITMCDIYPVRLGAHIAMGYHCGLRSETKYDFEGCPFNTGKPIYRGTNA